MKRSGIDWSLRSYARKSIFLELLSVEACEVLMEPVESPEMLLFPDYLGLAHE